MPSCVWKRFSTMEGFFLFFFVAVLSCDEAAYTSRINIFPGQVCIKDKWKFCKYPPHHSNNSSSSSLRVVNFEHTTSLHLDCILEWFLFYFCLSLGWGLTLLCMVAHQVSYQGIPTAKLNFVRLLWTILQRCTAATRGNLNKKHNHFITWTCNNVKLFMLLQYFHSHYNMITCNNVSFAQFDAWGERDRFYCYWACWILECGWVN